MAYLTHSAYQARARSARWSYASFLAGAAVPAVLIVALYAAIQGGLWSATDVAAGGKGDRLALTAGAAGGSAIGSSAHAGGVHTLTDDSGRVVFRQDQAQRTTTVVRDATIPLSGSSPYPGGK